MNRFKKILLSKPFIICAGILAIYTLAGFFLAPFLVRHYVPKIVEERLQRKAAIGEVRFNPFLYTFEANDFRMNEADGQPMAGFRRFFIDLELKSLIKWVWTFREVRLEGALVNAVIDPGGFLNIARLGPPEPASEAPAKSGALPGVILEELVIDQGEITFTDRRQSPPAAIVFKPLRLGIRNLTTLPGGEGSKIITVATVDGETMSWTGSISLNPVSSKGKFVLENLRAATLWKFIRDVLNVDSPAGKLTARKIRGQTLTLDIDPVILSTAFLKELSPDMRTENLWFALDTPE